MTTSGQRPAGASADEAPRERWGRRSLLGLGVIAPLLAACDRRITGAGGPTDPSSSASPLGESRVEEGASMHTPAPTTSPTPGHQQKLDDAVLADALALAPDGALVAGSASVGRQRSGQASTAGTVRTWRLTGSRCEVGPVIDARHLMPQSIAVSPDGRTLAIAGPGGQVEMWDVGSAEQTGTVEGTPDAPGAVAYAPDATLLIGTGGTPGGPEDARARLFSVAPGAGPLEGPAPRGRDVARIAVSQDGGHIACVGLGGNEIMLWRRADGGREDLPTTPGPVGGLALTADASRLYAAVRPAGMMVWDGATWSGLEGP